jgi:hypothetical protein
MQVRNWKEEEEEKDEEIREYKWRLRAARKIRIWSNEERERRKRETMTGGIESGGGKAKKI